MASRVTKPAKSPSTARRNPPPVASPAATTPPLLATGATPDEIRRLAYLKWEAAGRPEGDGFHFWVEAERELTGGP